MSGGRAEGPRPSEEGGTQLAWGWCVLTTRANRFLLSPLAPPPLLLFVSFSVRVAA